MIHSPAQKHVLTHASANGTVRCLRDDSLSTRIRKIFTEGCVESRMWQSGIPHAPWHARARTKSSGRGWHWLEDPEETAWDPLARTPELTLP